MRKLAPLFLVAVLMGCGKPTALQVPDPPAVAEATPTPDLSDKKTGPSPELNTSPPAPAPTANLAPEGIVYAKERVMLRTEETLQLLADAGERLQIVSRNGAQLKVRSERGTEFVLEESQTTNDLDEVAAIVSGVKQKRETGAIASKALRQANETAAALATAEIPKLNEQQVGMWKIRIRDLKSAIAAAETKKAQLHAAYSSSINDWGVAVRDRYGSTYYVKRSGITGGSAPNSAENKARSREANRLSQQIQQWRSELQQLESAIAVAEK